MQKALPSMHSSVTVSLLLRTDTFAFRQMAQSEFSASKAAERDDAAASLVEANTADGNSGKSFGEMRTCQYGVIGILLQANAWMARLFAF